MPTRSSRCHRPSKVTECSAHSVRISVICSSNRRPRLVKSWPRPSYSAWFQPTPTPSISREPDSRSSVAACFAASTALRWGRISTRGRNTIRSVTPARKLNSEKTSWKGSSIRYGADGNPPTGPSKRDASAPRM